MSNWWDAAPKVSAFDDALAAEGAAGKVADIARSIYQQESGSGKNTRTSNAGAVGGMQIIPSTFSEVADKGWDINNPEHNARAGVRYVKKLFEQAGGDPALTAAGYYGGPGGLEKARRGVAVSDPRNPNAPTTLQYGQQVASRIPKEKGLIQRGVEAVIPSANAAEPKEDWWSAYPVVEDAQPEDKPGMAASLGAGLGKGFGSVVLGAQNYVGKGLSAVGAEAPGKWLQDDATMGRAKLAAENAPYKDANPITNVAGELGGNIVATLPVGGALGAGAKAAGATRLGNALASSGMTVGGAAPTTMAQGAGNLVLRAAGGAGTGYVSAGLVDPESAGTGALIGGALPIAAKAAGTLGNAIGRTVAGKAMAPEVQALAQRAKTLGIDIPADRLVNSKPLNALASSLDYVPMSGRTATMNKMEDQLNTAVSKTFGQNSSNVTQALRKAGDELGSKFDDVLSQNTVKVDNQFLTDLADASSRAGKELGSDGAKIISNQVDEILAKASKTGEIDGQAAYNIKKTLDRIGKRNSPEGYYALDLKQRLMEALNRSLGPEEAKAFAGVRKQYGNMLSMEKLASNGAEGGVSIARLANMKNINNPELQELADISAQFLKSREGAHGAAQRVGAGALTFGLAGPGGLAAGMASGRGANMLLNSGMAKNALMGQPQPNGLMRLVGEPDLAQLLYRGAPVAGAQ